MKQPVSHSSPSRRSPLRWVWLAALACFLLAGATGAWYRFALLYDAGAGYRPTDIRHAHSHLMYFGWVTPLLFALIGGVLQAYTQRTVGRAIQWIIGATFAAALLAYPLFLLYGYRPIDLGAVSMPLSVIAASLNMLVWYAFIAWYALRSRGLKRTFAHTLFDLALAFLFLSTLGAWGLAVAQPLGLDGHLWSASLTHFFLDLFSEGWLVLALLGVAYAQLAPTVRPPQWALYLALAGLPLMFMIGMPGSLVQGPARVVAQAGSAAAGLGLLCLVVPLLWRLPCGRARWLWGLPLGLLALKLVAQIGISLVPGGWWSLLHLRVFYLHLLLLGVVSLGLVACAAGLWGHRGLAAWPWLYGAVGLLLFSLLPLAGYGTSMVEMVANPLRVATWIAPLPVLATAVLLLQGAYRWRRTPEGARQL